MCKVSIIVPVYNVGRYLERTVHSLLNQTHQNVEVLLIDDGSKDDSRQVMEKLSAEDSRVVALVQPCNQGVSAARNRGLDEMTGEWVCFCDGDDWYEPAFVEKMLNCAQQERADYIVCDYQIAVEGRAPLASGTVSELHSGCDIKRVIALGPISSCTHMFHRRLFEASGARYPVGRRQFEELPVIPVLAKYAERIGIVNEPLYNYFQRGDGTSASNTTGSIEENFLVSWKDMASALGEGYEKELEYHAVYSLLYGEVLNLCKQKKPAKDIIATIRRYKKQYPDYCKNPYLPYLGSAKRLFLMLLDLYCVPGLKLLSWVHGKIVG